MILGALGQMIDTNARFDVVQNTTAGSYYNARFITAYGTALTGLRIGVYSHCAVGRDLLLDLFEQLGADVIELGRSLNFIPIDTEAVDPAICKQLKSWAIDHRLDAIISTDGDGDRPLMTDANGAVIAGDILGQITGAALGADVAVTPVSSNTGAETKFNTVIRTRIGSPYVIVGMQQAGGTVIGYEANGGFLLGYTANGPVDQLPMLITRDAVLPLIAPLVQMTRIGGLAALVATQPARFTATGRLQHVALQKSKALIEEFDTHYIKRADFLYHLAGSEFSIDHTDGVRITLTDGRIVHLRASGNAPELRLYVDADSQAAAQQTLVTGLTVLQQAIADLPISQKG